MNRAAGARAPTERNSGSEDLSTDATSRVFGDVWTITEETVIHNGPHMAIFSVFSMEPLKGGVEGQLAYRLTRAKTPMTKVKVAPGVGVRHNVTGLVLNVGPSGKPWKVIVNQLVPG